MVPLVRAYPHGQGLQGNLGVLGVLHFPLNLCTWQKMEEGEGEEEGEKRGRRGGMKGSSNACIKQLLDDYVVLPGVPWGPAGHKHCFLVYSCFFSSLGG